MDGEAEDRGIGRTEGFPEHETFSRSAARCVKILILQPLLRVFSPRRSLSDYAKALRRDGERRSAGARTLPEIRVLPR